MGGRGAGSEWRMAGTGQTPDTAEWGWWTRQQLGHQALRCEPTVIFMTSSLPVSELLFT